MSARDRWLRRILPPAKSSLELFDQIRALQDPSSEYSKLVRQRIRESRRARARARAERARREVELQEAQKAALREYAARHSRRPERVGAWPSAHKSKKKRVRGGQKMEQVFKPVRSAVQRVRVKRTDALVVARFLIRQLEGIVTIFGELQEQYVAEVLSGEKLDKRSHEVHAAAMLSAKVGAFGGLKGEEHLETLKGRFRNALLREKRRRERAAYERALKAQPQ